MYITRFTRRSWVEIDIHQLKRNLDVYRSRLPEDAEIMAVVKADAYGHGDDRISAELNSLGVSLFAVSNIDEALLLRRAGVIGEILILGYTPIELAGELLKYDITQTLLSEEYAEKLLAYSDMIKCQFAIDTGMNRIGLEAGDASSCAEIIKKYSSRCILNGIFTHLSCADSTDACDVEYTKRQLERFERVAELVSDLDLQYIHCFNSAGGLFYNTQTKYNKIVRLGIVLYGLKSDYNNVLPNGIKQVLTWKTVVSHVKTIEAGDSVGYGRSFVAEKQMRIATLPTGYADGYDRRLSNLGYVMINGKKARIVGRVCMDQMMVDVSAIDDVSVGDEVILMGDGLTADDMAHMIGTIGYELICAISKRVARIYKQY